MEPEGSLPSSQEPTTGFFPEPDESSECYPLISVLVLSFHLRLWLPSGLFLCDCPTRTLYTFLFSPCVPHDLSILITFCEGKKLWRSSLHGFLEPPTMPSNLVPNFSSTLCSATPSIYVLPANRTTDVKLNTVRNYVPYISMKRRFL
jgi:hypothetical protein